MRHMADDSWLRAFPVGLILFVGTALGFARRAWHKHSARASFPELGARLGLAHSAPETPGAAGILKGELGGRKVRIESDTRARVVVDLGHSIDVDVRNYDRWVRLPPGLNPFAWGDRTLNAWLKTRLAAPELAPQLASDSELTRALRQLRDHPNLRELSAAEGRVELVFDFGARGLFPPEAAERGLAAAQLLADRLIAAHTASTQHRP